jgi:glycerophosphoryl diester phosphodiesterase
MSKGRIALLILAVIAVALSLFNASWLAGAPPGRMVLIANRGITHPLREGAAGPCAAVQIRPTEAQFIENTPASLRRALTVGAMGVAVDLRRTADNRMVAFRDETLDCRTDGTGPLAARTLAELKRLDAGYRYTSDGTTFPMRGWGRGAIPTAEELLYALPTGPVVFMMRGNEAADADALAAEFDRAGLAIDDARFGFIGAEPVLARLRTLAPKAWTYNRATGDACLSGYRATGWLGLVPDECRDATVSVVPGANLTLWGWPFRFLNRLSGVGGRAILAESHDDAGLPVGLASTDRIQDIPMGFTGFVWIEDMANVGAAIRR